MTRSRERILAEFGQIKEEAPTTCLFLAVDLGWGSKTLVDPVQDNIRSTGMTFVGISFQIRVLVSNTYSCGETLFYICFRIYWPEELVMKLVERGRWGDKGLEKRRG